VVKIIGFFIGCLFIALGILIINCLSFGNSQDSSCKNFHLNLTPHDPDVFSKKGDERLIFLRLNKTIEQDHQSNFKKYIF